MARVVLHVGTHKTGSTAVQEAFAANRKLLARHGFVYPEIVRRDTAHHGLASLWNRDLAPYEPRGGAEAAWRALARRHRASDDVLVLSTEEFSRISGRGAVDHAAIRAFLEGYERIDVVCLLRDQVSFVQSAYLQIAKIARADLADRPMPAWSTYFARALERGQVTALELDYNALLDRLEAAFGPERVHMVPYAEAAGRPGGAIGLVLREIGCPLDPSALSSPAGQQVNVAGDPLSAWIAAGITAPRRPPAALVETVERLVAKHVRGRTTLYTADEMRLLRERYEGPNERLARRLRGRRPGFALPWMDRKGLTKRAQMSPEFWVELSRALAAPRAER